MITFSVQNQPKDLGNQQHFILELARRNSHNLTLWETVMFYKEQGFTEEEIFEDYEIYKKQLSNKN